MTSRHTQVLTRSECMELLGQATVGRVAVSIDALPAVFPVRFGLFDRSVLLRTILGSRLDTATVGAVVAFQADDFQLEGTAGWSVLLQGMASAITDPAAVAEAAAVPMTPMAAEHPAERFVRIEVGELSGRRFGSLFDPAW